MRILAIETSCDETAVCLLEANGLKTFQVLGNALLSQANTHRKFGGVYPNLAKREHAKNLTPLLLEVLRQAHELKPASANQLSKERVDTLKELLAREPELFSRLMLFLAQHEKPHIDRIAVTNGPGLEPALWVGINFAKALSRAWNTPVVPVNHMEGHILSSVMRQEDKAAYRIPNISFPAIALLISGGHTELVLVRDWGHYEVLGETRDDAVGEAFDKVARMLGLPYPGGPEISRIAEEARASEHFSILQNGMPDIALPRPMINSNDCDFSFSGLKTAVLYLLKKIQDGQKISSIPREIKMATAKEFEDAAADVLFAKTTRAIEQVGARSLIIGGGVSANTHIRRVFTSNLPEGHPEVELFIPAPSLTTDNALMIAVAAAMHPHDGKLASTSIEARGTLPLNR